MTQQQNAFLKIAVPAAQFTQRMYGVPASITIAQAILESGWGKSELARSANNYFGIKVPSSGAYVEFETAEYVHEKKVMVRGYFASYDTVTQ